MKKELPELHRQAFKIKNSKKLQHDGGRAWIKDSQLHEARKGVNGRIMTIKDKKLKNTASSSDKVKSI